MKKRSLRNDAALRTPVSLSEGRMVARKKSETASDHETPCFVECEDGRRELRLGSAVVKCFRMRAPEQELLLAAFQEQDWPKRMDDPLPVVNGRNPKTRLHHAVNRLNQQQLKPLIRFHADGTGKGLYWEPARKKSARSTPHRRQRSS